MASFRIPQNPGIGGLQELTSTELLFIQNLAGLSYQEGDLLYYNGTNITRLPIGTAGQVLSVNAGADAPEWINAGSGSGDVQGPASSTDNAIARFDLTTGKVIQNSGVTISDTDVVLIPSLTASEIVITDASKNLVSADVATYPSLTELAYVKGVTSAIQTQLDAKEAALTFSTGLTRSTNTITSNISTGVAGGQTIYGGTAANEDLTIDGTTNATKSTSYVLIQPTGGSVGIGTTTPSYRLHVAGGTLAVDSGSGTDTLVLRDATLTKTAGTPINSNTGMTTVASVLANGWTVGNFNNGLFAPVTNSVALGTNGAERLRIDSSGNVGIGTTGPNERLDVTGNIGASGYLGLGNVNATDRSLIRSDFQGRSIYMTPATAGYSDMYQYIGTEYNLDRLVAFRYTPGTTGAQAGVLNIGQLAKVNANYTHGVTAFYTNGAERMRISNSGNVGIGSTTPNQKLVVAGNGTFANTTTGATQLRLSNVGSGVSSGLLADDGVGTEIFSLTRQASNTLSVSSFGNIGFAGGVTGGPSTTYQMYIAGSTGNVGIGTASPVALLTLGTAGTTAGTLSLAGGTSGVVTIQTAAAAGTYTLTLPTNDGDADQVLTTNGSGVLSWATPSGGSNFGGDGSDGSLSISSGKTTIDVGGAAYYTLNYTSLSITGTGSLAFSNPNTNGTVIRILVQGNATITSSETAAIDLRGMGAAGGAGEIANTTSAQNGNTATGSYGSDASGGKGIAGSTTGGTAQTKSFYLSSESALYRPVYAVIPGNGGGGGSNGDDPSAGNGGAGGRGGGALYMEVAGSLNFTGTINSSGAEGSQPGTSVSGAGYGGGGGGSAGMVAILYVTLTANSGTITATGGAGGTGGTGTGTGWSPGSGGSGAGSIYAAGGGGATGAASPSAGVAGTGLGAGGGGGGGKDGSGAGSAGGAAGASMGGFVAEMVFLA